MLQPHMSYRLFISHAWNEHEAYLRLLRDLKDVRGFNFRNYSVPEDIAYSRMRTDQLEQELKYQITPVDCVLVLGELYVGYAEWIQFEIDFAKSLDKPIIAITPWGSEHMPMVVAEAADEVVGWDTRAILSAIRKHTQ